MGDILSDEQILIRILTSVLVVGLLFSIYSEQQTRESVHEEGVQDGIERVLEDPEHYNLIRIDDAYDYAVDEYWLIADIED